MHVKLDAERQPNYVVVALTDPLLYRCPILFMEDVGTAELSEQEVENLREFFLKGGFLWVDDFWGIARLGQLGRTRSPRVLPPGEFPIFDIPLNHPIMHTLYDVKEVPQVLDDQLLAPATAADLRARAPTAPTCTSGASRTRTGRLMVLMSHNTDIADTWEREGENRRTTSISSRRAATPSASTSSCTR